MTKLSAHLPQADYAVIHGDIVALQEAARRAAARSVNAVMTATYWAVGRRIVVGEQGGQERAAYGEALIKRLGSDLSPQFGRGFGQRNLAQMRAFYLAWPADQILQMSSAKSSAPQIVQMPSAKSPAPQILQTASGQSIDLSVLEGLPNKVLAAEYRTVLPDEMLLAEELDKTRRELEARRIAHGGDGESCL